MHYDTREIQNLLRQRVDVAKRDGSYFFKTGPGQYAEHDKFVGVSVPTVRQFSRQYVNIPLSEVKELLESSYNEERLLALFILVLQYNKSDTSKKKELYQFYIDNIERVNNWNLVDSSAHHIVGAYLWEHNRENNILVDYAQSDNLWKRRIAIIATWYCIKKGDFTWALTIAQILLYDKHDLIHKAVGWMLREVGQKDAAQLRHFLDENAVCMPRTMLRYAIEKFPQDERLAYLKRK